MTNTTDDQPGHGRDGRERSATEYPWQFPLALVIEEHPTTLEDGRYLGTCTINGKRHHIELIPVTPEWESHIVDLMMFDGADGPYQSIGTRHGTEYVCAMTPYCR